MGRPERAAAVLLANWRALVGGAAARAAAPPPPIMARDMSNELPQVGLSEAADKPPVDGRRLRTLRNRQRIVDALLQLIESGDHAPRAERVAEIAGVGLRSVYRHFSDMESLYRDVGESLCQQVAPLVTSPLPGKDWRERLKALLDRKICLMRQCRPQFLFGRAQRHESAYARAAQDKTRAMERKALKRVWPPQLADDRQLFEAVDLLLSFDTWVRLRGEQKLSEARSRALVQRLLAGVLDPAGT